MIFLGVGYHNIKILNCNTFKNHWFIFSHDGAMALEASVDWNSGK